MMGKVQDATVTLNRALKLAEDPRGKPSASAYRRTLAMIVTDLADLAYFQGRFDDSAQLSSRVVELLDQLRTALVAERISVDPLYAAMAINRIAQSIDPQAANFASGNGNRDPAHRDLIIGVARDEFARCP